ncbi:MAG: DUF4876 domain-containing protein [Bacteroidales bacterium]|jgi:hypothetical protein|nr:DUF4876 domain-containing protein [Bacteroidales bacterium]
MIKNTFIQKTLTVLSAAVLLMFTSCSKDNSVKYLSATVSLDVSGISSNIPTPKSFDVTFASVGSDYTYTTHSNGTTINTDSLITGVYNITVAATVTENDFTYNYTGSLSNKEITSSGESCSITVSATKASDIIFKEIYYTGCRTSTNGIYFRDQFYELYNNSSHIVYADGICLAEALSYQIFDYTGAVGLEGDASNYLFCGKIIWKIPGNGTDYPVKPGESIVIAQYATNHKTANPNSPVDLSTADFETYIQDYSSKQTDCNAINMEYVCNASGNNSKQYLTSVFGTALIIFHPSIALEDSNFLEPTNGLATLARQVLKTDILDAVDCIKNDASLDKKRICNELDAGAIWCSGAYVGESISRKIEGTKSIDKGGQIIYQDTNNSTNDFQVNTTPEIRRNNAGRPSWSDWTSAQN